MKDIGKNIRALRIQKRMTQDALAEALFVTRQTVSNYETGRSRPDVYMLMDIAKALDTDANSVLYGPPVPESRKTAYKRMLLGGALLAVLGVAVAIVYPLTEAMRRHYSVFPSMLLSLTLYPAFMLALGWCVLHGIGLLSGAKPCAQAWVKQARRGLLMLLAVCALLLCPFLAWLVFVVIQDMSGQAYAASFVFIPGYQQIVDAILKITFQYPALYFALGGLLWLFGFPCGKAAARICR